MFWPDVIALKEFYNSPLGRISSRNINAIIKDFWDNCEDGNTLGVGFCPPYLAHLIGKNNRVFACMPAAQGVIHWPAQGPNLSLISSESELPFPDNSMQRVVVAHALENSESARQMLAEIWRVLSPSGRLLVIVPNRIGIWARSPKSPFAYGQPFTYWQLRKWLTNNSFTPVGAGSALFYPPTEKKFILRTTGIFENIGRVFFSGFGGVLTMEAEKQIYAPTLQKARISAKVEYIPAIPQPV